MQPSAGCGRIVRLTQGTPGSNHPGGGSRGGGGVLGWLDGKASHPQLRLVIPTIGLFAFTPPFIYKTHDF